MASDSDPSALSSSRRRSVRAGTRASAPAAAGAAGPKRTAGNHSARARAGGGASPPRLRVAVCDWRGVPVKAPGLARWLTGVAPGAARGAVTLVLVGDARMRTLNRTYRGFDYATDVLSFPNDEPDVPTAAAAAKTAPARNGRGGAPARAVAPMRHLGDVVIATGVAARQANAAKHALATELRVLALHGLLHLLGYDHEHEDDRGTMARLERRLRRRGGLREGLIERAV